MTTTGRLHGLFSAPGAISGLAEELSELLDVRVDVVAASLLRHEVSASALVDAVAV